MSELIKCADEVLRVLEYHGTINNRDDRAHALRRAVQESMTQTLNSVSIGDSDNTGLTVRGKSEIAKSAVMDRIELLERLLRRYRNETPLGHQPHMIAHEVDEVLDVK